MTWSKSCSPTCSIVSIAVGLASRHSILVLVIAADSRSTQPRASSSSVTTSSREPARRNLSNSRITAVAPSFQPSRRMLSGLLAAGGAETIASSSTTAASGLAAASWVSSEAIATIRSPASIVRSGGGLRATLSAASITPITAQSS